MSLFLYIPIDWLNALFATNSNSPLHLYRLFIIGHNVKFVYVLQFLNVWHVGKCVSNCINMLCYSVVVYSKRAVKVAKSYMYCLCPTRNCSMFIRFLLKRDFKSILIWLNTSGQCLSNVVIETVLIDIYCVNQW